VNFDVGRGNRAEAEASQVICQLMIHGFTQDALCLHFATIANEDASSIALRLLRMPSSRSFNQWLPDGTSFATE
jgi:hypothetical protein